MELLQLSPELVQQILVQAVAVRGLNRGLRLRLVCKYFAAQIVDAVIASEVLKDHCRESDLLHRKNRWGGLQHRYYVPFVLRQILRTPLHNLPTSYRVIVEAADRLSQTTGIPYKSRREYIQALIPLVLASCPRSLFREKECDTSKYDADINLFVAAAWLNLLPVVRAMIDSLIEQHGIHLLSPTFDRPYVAAAMQNNHEVLFFYLEKVSAISPSKILNFDFEDVRTRALSVAAQCGHLETVDMLLADNWPPFSIQRTPERDYQFHEGKSRMNGLNGTFNGALNTANKAVFLRVYEYAQLRTILAPKLPVGRARERFWAKCVRSGDAEMLRWVLGTHSPESYCELSGYPLELAAGIGNVKVLQVLLDYSAPLGRISSLVSHAAAGGHFDVVKMLVEQGYDMNQPGDRSDGRRVWNFPSALPPPIVSAIVLEHVPMFQYLRDAGAVFDTPETCGEAVGRAKANGLQSMLELLARDGVDLDKFPPSCKEKTLCNKCKYYNDTSTTPFDRSTAPH